MNDPEDLEDTAVITFHSLISQTAGVTYRPSLISHVLATIDPQDQQQESNDPDDPDNSADQRNPLKPRTSQDYRSTALLHRFVRKLFIF